MDQVNAFLARPLFAVGNFAPSAGLVIIVVLVIILAMRWK